MTLSAWLVYALAVLVLTVTPGPSVLVCVSTSINLGARSALITAFGSTAAIVCIMGLSALGLGATLAASETLFTVLKWVGAGYLLYLGVASIISADRDITVPETTQTTSKGLFVRGLLVGASNPKALLFFGALFPQFIVPGQPHLPQFVLLGVTFVFLELFWLGVYTLFAAKAKSWLQQPRRARLFNRTTGVVFVLAAGLLANSKRADA
ncbi:Threonine/homoserine/homoserine lactone efflux protein [Halopseudomonas xinjiangensis]|uniref:Threonine/homoserine/homoserine lactone efflux protein n=1 Tax=Halopseudomonas xinjiangensis TaxID=487184 RepID=A0A1H1TTY1_9GAMM|nr:LysE family transporter [Halopseudomonas xinjiangensis]SDS63551.1 Threonine/homoserine/homoserine lactone efflux protein [Halopseudomonas xinjiangensis]